MKKHLETKYICPECAKKNKIIHLVVKNVKPECPICGFICRRQGNTVIDAKDDRRGFANAQNWETIEIPFDLEKYQIN